MPDYVIEISNQQTALADPPAGLDRVVEGILRDEGIRSAEISVVLVDDATIRDINRNYLQHDYATDVISFLLEVDEASGHLEGELVVSLETAVREAPAHGWTASDEALLYVVHGLLHLCGYDDLTDEARPRMRLRERQILADWNLIPTGLEA